LDARGAFLDSAESVHSKKIEVSKLAFEQAGCNRISLKTPQARDFV
jgi:hypothetical protein